MTQEQTNPANPSPTPEELEEQEAKALRAEMKEFLSDWKAKKAEEAAKAEAAKNNPAPVVSEEPAQKSKQKRLAGRFL